MGNDIDKSFSTSVEAMQKTTDLFSKIYRGVVVDMVVELNNLGLKIYGSA